MAKNESMMTHEQTQLKIIMILKYGNLNEAFWSGDKFIPAENRILEINLMETTSNTNVKIKD